MTTDRVFVLMMMVLLMMSGCFGATTTTEAQEEQESTNENNDSSDPIDSGSGTQTNSNNGANSASSSQERTWYSSGGAIDSYWTDGQDVYIGSNRCLEFGPAYDSNTGEYIGEECKRYGIPQNESDWLGAGAICNGSLGYGEPGFFTSSTAQCFVTTATITTNSGEALLIYEMSNVKVNTYCNGILASTINGAGSEYIIASGSALNCTHDVIVTQHYSQAGSPNVDNMKIWSIVYAIQDTTVV